MLHHTLQNIKIIVPKVEIDVGQQFAVVRFTVIKKQKAKLFW